MRTLLTVAVLALVASLACVADLAGSLSDDQGNPAAPGVVACAVDADCVPAAATCCECPTFAVTRGDPVVQACSNVQCEPGGPGEPSACATNVVARCNEDLRCELACKPIACEQTGAACEHGYAKTMNGCLSCECAVPEPNGCAADTDCVRTRDDCCGCQQGGFDTAVLASARAEHDARLMCAPVPACPGIDTCTTDEPTCVQGRCELASPELPVGACGRADLPACPAGEVCMVNVSDQANMHGVGVCRPRA